MPVFKVHIEREVTQTDRFTRYIEAETEDAARVKAVALAEQADDSCPDDAACVSHDNCGDWWPNEISAVTEVLEGEEVIS